MHAERTTGYRHRAAGCLLLLPLLAACGGGQETTPPSVILVVVDTLRRDHLGIYGYPRATSPHLDLLADDAAVFARCLAPSSWTQPSTVSLLTGLYPARHGAHSYQEVDPAIRFLAEELHDRGYATGGFSGNPNASPLFGMDQGFDHYWFPGNDLAREYPDITEILAQARAWLAEPRSGPFFLYLHLMNVHGPYLAPPEYRERFLPEEWSDFPFRNPLWSAIMVDGEVARRAEVTPAQVADLTARYDGAIAYTDEELGLFFDELAADGTLDRSLLVVTADHGEELFDHGGFGHGWTLEPELLDVPLIVRPPGGGRHQIHDPVSLVDVPATVLDTVLAGAGGMPAFGDGTSLLPLLAGGSLPERPLFSQVKREQNAAFSLQLWPLRLVQIDFDYASKEPRTELYQLEADPAGRENRAADKPDLVRELAATATALRARMEEDRFAARPVELDDAWRQRLGALGYGVGK